MDFNTSKMDSGPNFNKKAFGNSLMFQHSRIIGCVSNQVPATLKYIKRRKESLITSCIGSFFQVYTSNHFRLIHVSAAHPADISVLATDRHYTYAATGNTVYAWRAGKNLYHTFLGLGQKIIFLLPLGNNLLVVDDDNVLVVWEIETEHKSLEIPFNKSDFHVSAICHPPTYINKIVLGSKQGLIKLWNIKDNRLLYTFSGHGNCITVMQPAPALDVMAVGYQDGFVLLLNLRFNTTLLSFTQNFGSVSQITFRTDGPPIMITGSTSGHLAFWNLEEKKIVSQLQAHESCVTTAVCFSNEPLLLTTSSENSMKLWIMDMPDGGARLLRMREGHACPPLCIRYHGSTGCSILSAGEDSSLRVFNTISESLNRSMGHARYRIKSSKSKHREHDPKMPPITQFTSETRRENEWDNVAAIHLGISQTTTWSFAKKKIGDHRLVPDCPSKKSNYSQSESTCLTLTQCGNFVIVGYSTGHVENFNIQSGNHRSCYGNPAHDAAIRGVCSNNLNHYIVTGCGDGYIKYWHFKDKVSTPTDVWKLADGVILMRIHRESNMIAVALANFDIHIIDSENKNNFRQFVGHCASINDVDFSPDSRWIFSASMDSTIKVWDIASAVIIDNIQVERPCISISMSPVGNYMATAHVNYLGIYLWTNKMLFKQVSLRSIPPADESLVELKNDENLNIITYNIESRKQLSKELITLYGWAKTCWENVLDLEIIQIRNKPKLTRRATKPQFFLPTIKGLEMKFIISKTEENYDTVMRSNPKNLNEFAKMLEDTETSLEYEKFVTFLDQLSTSLIEFHVKSLHPDNGGSNISIIQFLKTILHIFKTNNYFELAQTYLCVFLRVFGSELSDIPDVDNILLSILKSQEECWKRIEKKLIYGLGVVSALKHVKF